MRDAEKSDTGASIRRAKAAIRKRKEDRPWEFQEYLDYKDAQRAYLKARANLKEKRREWVKLGK